MAEPLAKSLPLKGGFSALLVIRKTGLIDAYIDFTYADCHNQLTGRPTFVRDLNRAFQEPVRKFVRSGNWLGYLLRGGRNLHNYEALPFSIKFSAAANLA